MYTIKQDKITVFHDVNTTPKTFRQVDLYLRWSTCVIFIKKKITVYKAVQIKLGH